MYAVKVINPHVHVSVSYKMDCFVSHFALSQDRMYYPQPFTSH